MDGGNNILSRVIKAGAQNMLGGKPEDNDKQPAAAPKLPLTKPPALPAAPHAPLDARSGGAPAASASTGSPASQSQSALESSRTSESSPSVAGSDHSRTVTPEDAAPAAAGPGPGTRLDLGRIAPAERGAERVDGDAPQLAVHDSKGVQAPAENGAGAFQPEKYLAVSDGVKFARAARVHKLFDALGHQRGEMNADKLVKKVENFMPEMLLSGYEQTTITFDMHLGKPRTFKGAALRNEFDERLRESGKEVQFKKLPAAAQLTVAALAIRQIADDLSRASWER